MFKYVFMSIGILALLSVYYETPSLEQVFLVESLHEVEFYKLSDYNKEIDEQKVNPSGFSLIRIRDYERDFNSSAKKVIVFLTYGSHGHFFQIPPLLNALYNHTKFLNHQLIAFSFDFKKMPSAFSK